MREVVAVSESHQGRLSRPHREAGATAPSEKERRTRRLRRCFRAHLSPTFRRLTQEAASGCDTSLVPSGESPTRGERGDSGSQTGPASSEEGESGGEWNRQQKRTYHRVLTLLHYWEANDYLIRWITLTSSPESPDASDYGDSINSAITYNHQKLRQTVERAKLAYDHDGRAHRLSHIRDLEHITIRTSEGHGVIHTFWAWKPPAGNHSQSFYIPQKWLSDQWERLHNAPVVDIQQYGKADYHDRSHVARYCASQYVGDHGEALETVSWSWERSLGGPVAETWERLKRAVNDVGRAIEVWNRVLEGERVVVHEQRTGSVLVETVVKPPPDFGCEELVTVGVEGERGAAPADD